MLVDTDFDASKCLTTSSSSVQSSSTSDGERIATSDIASYPKRRTPPRKGHTKSRQGCLSCKRRRVKCQETLPRCGNCRRLGLICEYASAARVCTSPSNNLPSTPTQFSLEDLHFFHHFLLHAFPPLPIKGDHIWREVAALSHSYDFLVHAMLGLAASHLALSNGCNYSSQALSHRVKSINALNHALNKPCVSKPEGDARFATIMALTFQSSYMVEGMLEFLSMVRGCVVVSNSAMPCFEESIFRCFSQEEHEKAVWSLNESPPVSAGETGELFAAMSSLKAIGPLCRSTLEIRFLSLLENTLENMKASYSNAITGICSAYTLIGEAENQEFEGFATVTNHAAQLIISHFFIIEYMVFTPVLRPVQGGFPFRKSIVATWAWQVAEHLPRDLRRYMEWPLKFPDLMPVDHFGSE